MKVTIRKTGSISYAGWMKLPFSYLIYVIRDEAEMEYLKIAQDLEMYGVSYFEIKVSLLINYLVRYQCYSAMVLKDRSINCNLMQHFYDYLSSE